MCRKHAGPQSGRAVSLLRLTPRSAWWPRAPSHDRFRTAGSRQHDRSRINSYCDSYSCTASDQQRRPEGSRSSLRLQEGYSERSGSAPARTPSHKDQRGRFRPSALRRIEAPVRANSDVSYRSYFTVVGYGRRKGNHCRTLSLYLRSYDFTSDPRPAAHSCFKAHRSLERLGSSRVLLKMQQQTRNSSLCSRPVLADSWAMSPF